ncbi:mCG148253 [Mus musculus]|jgi:hypothetical protein|nr:mCG148253 [Mus musculus]
MPAVPGLPSSHGLVYVKAYYKLKYLYIIRKSFSIISKYSFPPNILSNLSILFFQSLSINLAMVSINNDSVHSTNISQMLNIDICSKY